MPKQIEELEKRKIERPVRLKLSAEESLERMKEFPKRKEAFISAIRKGKDPR